MLSDEAHEYQKREVDRIAKQSVFQSLPHSDLAREEHDTVDWKNCKCNPEITYDVRLGNARDKMTHVQHNFIKPKV